MPKVSVIIPVYNCERFVGAAIESVLSQTYEDYELIVVDDGSQDETLNIISNYREKIRILSQPNSGQATARNLGYKNSTGEYLAFLDADDIWYPHFLECEATILDTHPQVGLVYSDLDIIDETGAVIERAHLSKRSQKKRGSESYLGKHAIPFPSASLKRRVVFEQSGAFDESFRRGGEDALLWAKMYRFADFYWVRQSLAQRRIHNAQVSHSRPHRLEADILLCNKLWELFSDNPEEQSKLLMKYARIWSREGQHLVREGRRAEARSYFKRSFRFNPFYWRNYFRFAKSFLVN
jgi:glycosyltransferase involved in cell wall biosynthesis